MAHISHECLRDVAQQWQFALAKQHFQDTALWLYLCSFSNMVQIGKSYVTFLQSVDADARDKDWVLAAAAFLAVVHMARLTLCLHVAFVSACAGKQDSN
jgi:hypothetical protein